jgi:hypothetical protein
MSPRRFPPPWTAIRAPGGYRVDDANGVTLAFVYGRDDGGAAHRNLTVDEARRIALAVAQPPELQGRGDERPQAG